MRDELRGPWPDYPTARGVALVAASLLAGFAWEFGFYRADFVPTRHNWWIWLPPAPLWAAVVAVVVFSRRRDLTRALGTALVAASAAFGGGLLGVVAILSIYGTGD